MCGVFTVEAVTYFQHVYEKDAGCDTVVLGCTEIPVTTSDINSPLPTLDSTRLLARAALRRAVAAQSMTDPSRSACFSDQMIGPELQRLYSQNAFLVAGGNGLCACVRVLREIR